MRFLQNDSIGLAKLIRSLVTKDMNSSDPQYLDVASTLHREIENLAPNSLLPTEVQLAKRFGVSRVTIRRAMEMLESSGLISRMRGRGTIVCPPKITRRFSPLFTFEQDLSEQGIDFKTQLLGFGMVHPPSFIQQRLRLEKEQEVGFLMLLRLVDDQIICHDRRYFAPSVARELETALPNDREVMPALEELLGIKISDVDWESEIISSSSEVADNLRVTPGTLIVSNTFTYYLENGEAVEAGVMSYRIDRCKFKFCGRFNETMRNGVVG